MTFPALFRKRWFAGVVLLIIALVGVGATRAFIQRMGIQGEIQTLKDSISKQQSRQNQYSKVLDKIKDFTYIEREARVKLALKEPGEKVFVVPNELLPTVLNTPVLGREKSNPERWWDYFFGERKE